MKHFNKILVAFAISLVLYMQTSAQGQTITIGTLYPPSPSYCGGDTVLIPFNVTSPAPAGVYKATLYDALSGVQGSATGTLLTNTSGVIVMILPLFLNNGSNYSIRVSHPAITSPQPTKPGIAINGPVGKVTFLTGDTAVCVKPRTYVYTATATNATGFKYYSNNKTNVEIDSLLGTATFTNPGPAPVSVTIFAMPSGCGSPTSEFLGVTIYPPPQAPIISNGPDFKICAGATWLNIGVKPDPSVYLIWESSPGGAYIHQFPDSTQRRYVLANFPEPGDAHVKVSAFLNRIGCRSTTTDSVLKVAGAANMDLEVKRSINSLVALASDVSKYQWGWDDRKTLKDSLLPGQTAHSFSDSLDTSKYYYWVMVTYKDGCVQKAYYNAPQALSIHLGVQPIQAGSTMAVKLYPNPAQRRLTVELPPHTSGHRLFIRVYDLSGKLLKGVSGSGPKTDVSTDDLMPGFYLISCEMDGIRVTTDRFIKQ